jgi:hypothetical protein
LANKNNIDIFFGFRDYRSKFEDSLEKKNLEFVLKTSTKEIHNVRV